MPSAHSAVLLRYKVLTAVAAAGLCGCALNLVHLQQQQRSRAEASRKVAQRTQEFDEATATIHNIAKAFSKRKKRVHVQVEVEEEKERWRENMKEEDP